MKNNKNSSINEQNKIIETAKEILNKHIKAFERLAK